MNCVIILISKLQTAECDTRYKPYLLMSSTTSYDYFHKRSSMCGGLIALAISSSLETGICEILSLKFASEKNPKIPFLTQNVSFPCPLITMSLATVKRNDNELTRESRCRWGHPPKTFPRFVPLPTRLHHRKSSAEERKRKKKLCTPPRVREKVSPRVSSITIRNIFSYREI